MTRICDIQQDTQCTPCPLGSFNSKPTKDSSCQACDVCPELFYEWAPCSGVMNTVCVSCQEKPQGSGNEDYLEKCERTTTPLPPALHPSSTVSMGGRDTPEFIFPTGDRFPTLEDGGSGDIDNGEILIPTLSDKGVKSTVIQGKFHANNGLNYHI